MKLQKNLAAAALLATLLASPAAAQRAGFQVGIAPAPGQMAVAGFGHPGFAPFPAPAFHGNTFAIAQPAPVFVFHPTQAPLVVTNRGFGRHGRFVGHPFAGTPFGGFGVQSPHIVTQPHIVGPAQVIGPHQVILPGSTIAPPHVITPHVIPQPVILPPAHAPFGSPQAHIVFPAGTPRARVIRHFGPPTVTVITRGTETLHFNGGVTVVIQDGNVAGAK